jgi:hypothetical protein
MKGVRVFWRKLGENLVVKKGFLGYSLFALRSFHCCHLSCRKVLDVVLFGLWLRRHEAAGRRHDGPLREAARRGYDDGPLQKKRRDAAATKSGGTPLLLGRSEFSKNVGVNDT